MISVHTDGESNTNMYNLDTHTTYTRSHTVYVRIPTDITGDRDNGQLYNTIEKDRRLNITGVVWHQPGLCGLLQSTLSPSTIRTATKHQQPGKQQHQQHTTTEHASEEPGCYVPLLVRQRALRTHRPPFIITSLQHSCQPPSIRSIII